MAACGECEFFGNFVEMILSPEWACIEEPGGKKRYYRPFVGFDETRGAHCDCKDRRPANVRIYPDTPACRHFKPRGWTRPENCFNCFLCHGRMDDGSFLCSGWPFYKKEGDKPCQNGRAYYGENLKLF